VVVIYGEEFFSSKLRRLPLSSLSMSDAVRQKVTQKFADILGGERASKLEKYVFNHVVRSCRSDNIEMSWSSAAFRYRYTTKALSLCFNMRNPKNPDLLRRINDGEMTLRKLVRASPSEMFPDLWEPIFQLVATRQLRKQLTENPSTAPDGAFKCSRCKSMKTTYTELQTRSADEPSTLYIACMSCGKRWKS
jgi:DNA-directed RNA polymerase subunit M/transcription elongation factor TFIIS